MPFSMAIWRTCLWEVLTLELRPLILPLSSATQPRKLCHDSVYGSSLLVFIVLGLSASDTV